MINKMNWTTFPQKFLARRIHLMTSASIALDLNKSLGGLIGWQV